MPLIEELPVTTTVKASHGWAYVPDTGPIAAQQPGTRHDRKRAAAGASRNAATTSAKKEKAIQQRLDALNKENYKDGVSVPIPPRTGAASRDKGKKMTSNVRRILAYQRNFAHYLADEEANHPGATHYALPALSSSMAPPPAPSGTATPTQRTGSKDTGRRKSGRAQSTATGSEGSRPSTPTTIPQSQPRGTKRGRPSSRSQSLSQPNIDEPDPSQKDPDIKMEELQPEQPPQSGDTAMTDVPPPQTSSTSTSNAEHQQQPTQDPSPPDYPTLWDTDPLLASSPSDVPPMPTARIMQLLISEPPLTYTAARATPLDPDKQLPARKFCGICGYWGRVKCRKCEDWTCGVMECWKGHEAVCIMAGAY